MRRTPDDIDSDILKLIRRRGALGKTAIVYGANLNFKIVKKYLVRLTDRGLLRSEIVDGREVFQATAMADAFVDTLDMLRSI